MMSTPAPGQRFDAFCVDGPDCGPPATEETPATFPQVPDGTHYVDNDLPTEDTCVSLDPETMNSLLLGLSECLGTHNFYQLLNSQDSNSNITDTNLNHLEAGPPPVSSFGDQFYNPEIPQDFQDIFLRQVKTEDDSWKPQQMIVRIVIEKSVLVLLSWK